MKICGLMKTTLLDFPGHVACTIFTGGCNFRCPFCHNAELLDINMPSEYSEEEIFAFLEKRHHTLEGVAITGGEPTLQPDLPDFIRQIRERFGLQIKLDTNGYRPEVLKALVQEGLLDYVAMDIKAGPSGYGRVSGVPGLRLEPVLESIAFLLTDPVSYEFRTTVVKGLHTREDFQELGPMIAGCRSYFLQSYKDSGNILDKEAGFSAFSKEELLDFCQLVKPYVGQVSLRGVDY